MCEAYQLDIVADLPVKPSKRPRRDRYFHYFVIHNDSGLVLRKRTADDIWKGMYDFPLVETDSPGILSDTDIANAPVVKSLSQHTSFRILQESVHAESQILSHQKIHCLFYPIFADDIDQEIQSFKEYVIVAHGDESKFAVPKAVDCYFRVKSIFL
jgi:A/G-specific adenine glycosylase